MPEGYIELEHTRYDGDFPSNKAFRVIYDERFFAIPAAAVHAHSEIYLGCHCQEGTLILSEHLAVEKGMVDAEPEGSGLVFKKKPGSRLTPPDYLLSEGQLKKIQARTEVYPDVRLEDGDLLVGCEAVGFCVDDGVMRLLANGAGDIANLLDEVRNLRRWAKKVCGG